MSGAMGTPRFRGRGQSFLARVARRRRYTEETVIKTVDAQVARIPPAVGEKRTRERSSDCIMFAREYMPGSASWRGACSEG